MRTALEVPRSFGHTHHVYHQIACVYGVLGETDKAMAWLERSVDTGFACWPFFRIDPHLAHLRQKPEFIRLTADLEHKYTSLKIRSGTTNFHTSPGGPVLGKVRETSGEG